MVSADRPEISPSPSPTVQAETPLSLQPRRPLSYRGIMKRHEELIEQIEGRAGVLTAEDAEAVMGFLGDIQASRLRMRSWSNIRRAIVTFDYWSVLVEDYDGRVVWTFDKPPYIGIVGE